MPLTLVYRNDEQCDPMPDLPERTVDLITGLSTAALRSFAVPGSVECVYLGRSRRAKGSAELDLLIVNGFVSARHATITFDHGQWFVTDDGSTNGSALNKRRLEKLRKYPIQDGDTLLLTSKFEIGVIIT